MSRKRQRTIPVGLPARKTLQLCSDVLQTIGVEISGIELGAMMLEGRRKFGLESQVVTLRVRPDVATATTSCLVHVTWAWPIVKLWGNRYLDKGLDDFERALAKRVKATTFLSRIEKPDEQDIRMEPRVQGGSMYQPISTKFCIGCGTKLPDSAAFCSRCGAQQLGGANLSGASQEWETAEVEARMGKVLDGPSFVSSLFGGRPVSVMQLVAQAYSSEGTDPVFGTEFQRLEYSDTPEQPLGLNREAMQRALDMIDLHMRETGWEPLPRGPHWYSYRNRRLL